MSTPTMVLEKNIDLLSLDIGITRARIALQGVSTRKRGRLY